MILSVRCDKLSFKNIEFRPGFNVVLAERTKEAKDKDSRNALGKSLLIEIIHFCLGADLEQGKGLGVSHLKDWTFTLDISLCGKKYSISRNTNDYKKVIIEGDFSDWPVKPEKDDEKNIYFLRIKDWRDVLGVLMFNLPAEIPVKKYVPTFRSLFSYFCRRRPGAYQDPFKQFSQQREWDLQVNNAYLLNLNWEYASDLQRLKDQEDILNKLKEAASQGLIKEFIGSIGELEALKVNLEEQIKLGAENIKSFRVHPQYHQIQQDIDKLTSQIHVLVNKSNITNQIFKKYKENIQEEKYISIDKIKDVYQEVGVVFPDKAIKRIDDVVNFTKEVIKNRKEYISSEIDRLENEIKRCNAEIEALSNKRAQSMEILSTHGALEEYMKLQERHSGVVNQLKEVEGRIDNLRKFEEGRSALKIEREQLLLQARRDLQARETQRSVAIKYFNEHSQSLYAESGILSIEFVNTGYKFNVDIKGSGSYGIGHMKVFCYDLSLVKMWSKLKDMPGLLIHDSVIFDGVDERQIAKALELAKAEAERYGFQYICTMNSDIIPRADLSKDFDFDKYVVRKFTDATPDGGLLGIRF
jgi:uncharacterized protein YydD (DUF2326 family)